MIDASLDTRIATELKKRGRNSLSAAELGVHRMLDPQLLEALKVRLPVLWVFVTGDDRLPFEHADVVRRLGTTIATLDGRWQSICERAGVPLNQDHYKHETVHRWAHVMADQAEGTVKRYSILGHRAWKPRRRYT